MVFIDKLENCGKAITQLVVDKSDNKHRNRVLRLTEKKIPELNYHKYSVSVDWSKGQYAADMDLSKDDIEDLIKNLQEIASAM